MDILLVEDDRTLALILADALLDGGHAVTTLHDGAAALAWLSENFCELVVTDVRLPSADGIQILERARKQDPPAEVLVMTGYATVDQAVAAMKGGAVSYLQKPFPQEALLSLVERVQANCEMAQELRLLRLQVASTGDPYRMTGDSATIQEVRVRLQQAADANAAVLIVGESGTGKERAARSLHQNSARSELTFMPVSCEAIPPSLLEGELFGYCKGAFTGAEQDHEGLFIQAGAGTLFLDDIDDLTPHAQAALLRVLQEREVTPLGATAPIPVHATVLAASKIDLADAIRDGHFREDLYHRLAVVPLRLPPLRERRSDLPALLADFFSRLDPEGRFTVSPDTLDRLARYDWPGNTRELENSATRAIALAGRMRSLRQEHFLPGGASITSGIRPENILPLREQIRLAERLAIRESLMATDGLRGAAANLLGISRKVFWAKAKELGLEDPKEDATRGDA